MRVVWLGGDGGVRPREGRSTTKQCKDYIMITTAHELVGGIGGDGSGNGEAIRP